MEIKFEQGMTVFKKRVMSKKAEDEIAAQMYESGLFSINAQIPPPIKEQKYSEANASGTDRESGEAEFKAK